jgi:aminoglycoside 3-N-acetyltransferase I
MKKIVIKELMSIQELRQLITVYSLAFEQSYQVTNEYLSKLLSNQHAVMLGAWDDNVLLGGIVAFEMSPIHGRKELYVYDIAVHPDSQKSGIGRALLEKLKLIAKLRGVSVIFVEAESEDEGAVSFYRTVGGKEVAVNHFNFDC